MRSVRDRTLPRVGGAPNVARIGTWAFRLRLEPGLEAGDSGDEAGAAAVPALCPERSVVRLHDGSGDDESEAVAARPPADVPLEDALFLARSHADAAIEDLENDVRALLPQLRTHLARIAARLERVSEQIPDGLPKPLRASEQLRLAVRDDANGRHLRRDAANELGQLDGPEIHIALELAPRQGQQIPAGVQQLVRRFPRRPHLRGRITGLDRTAPSSARASRPTSSSRVALRSPVASSGRDGSIVSASRTNR